MPWAYPHAHNGYDCAAKLQQSTLVLLVMMMLSLLLLLLLLLLSGQVRPSQVKSTNTLADR